MLVQVARRARPGSRRAARRGPPARWTSRSAWSTSFSGCTACSTGSRWSSTCSSSTAVRGAVLLDHRRPRPAAAGRGSAGSAAPRSARRTASSAAAARRRCAGSASTLSGSSARSSSAPSPVGVIAAHLADDQPAHLHVRRAAAAGCRRWSVSSVHRHDRRERLVVQGDRQATSTATTTMNTEAEQPAPDRAPSCSLRAHPRDPHRRRGAPDGEAEEEVEQRRGDDRGAHRAAHRDADARRARRSRV